MPTVDELLRQHQASGATGKIPVITMAAPIKPTGGYAAMTPTQKVKWDELFKRSAAIRESGAKEIQEFMRIFDLQLYVLRDQQPRPELQSLVDNIRVSIAKARGYLAQPQPYGIADAQWSSLRETTGHAEEVVERYEMAIEDMERLAQQEAEVAALEQTAALPQAQVTEGAASAPAPGWEPSPEVSTGSSVGWVVGGLLTATALGVGGWFLLKRKKSGKKKGK